MKDGSHIYQQFTEAQKRRLIELLERVPPFLVQPVVAEEVQFFGIMADDRTLNKKLSMILDEINGVLREANQSGLEGE